MPSSLIETAYERAFRALLFRLRTPKLQRGVEVLLRKAVEKSCAQELSAESLQHVYTSARHHTIQYLSLRRESRRNARTKSTRATDPRAMRQTTTALDEGIVRQPSVKSPDFHCDSGLGGLARWLRAAGYDARFWPYIADEDLVKETMCSSAILLTTDEPLMDRAAVTWGVVPALLVPLEIGKHAQFSFVSQTLSLPRKSSRCMACGGTLMMVDKQSVRDRIPPRTYPWIDEYYECARCSKLFWPGTHWKNVMRQLGPLECGDSSPLSFSVTFPTVNTSASNDGPL